MNKTFIENCIMNALEHKSKCSNSVLKINGMCGIMTRHLYNNLCSLPNSNYLEIGCYQGASTISSLYKNILNATIIDNWSEFSGSKYTFTKNLSKYIEKDRLNNIQIISENCFNLTKQLLYAPYNIFIYDGSHDESSHQLAIINFWPYLDKKSLIIIDDWNWESVQKNTLIALEKMNANIIYKKEILFPLGEGGFWNGCCLFLIEKL
jgi:hypothetical protein